jgi:hypothetical protein
MKISPLNNPRSPIENEGNDGPVKKLKIRINPEVRETITNELQDACAVLDAANGDCSCIDAQVRRESARARVITAACRILHHATLGRRYDLMSKRWAK